MPIGACHRGVCALITTLQYCNPAEHVMKMIYVSAESQNKHTTTDFVKIYRESAECARQLAVLEVCMSHLWEHDTHSSAASREAGERAIQGPPQPRVVWRVQH